MRLSLIVGMFALFSVSPALAGEFVLVEEDFENGWGDWTVVAPEIAPDDELPVQIWPIYPDNTTDIPGLDDWWASWTRYQAVGFTSNTAEQDDLTFTYLTKTFHNVIPADGSVVSIQFDTCAYVYHENATQQSYHVGAYMLALTNDLVGDPDVKYAGGMPAYEGISTVMWPWFDAYDKNGHWYIGMALGGQVASTTGDVEIRLLMDDKNPGLQAVAWDRVDIVAWNASGSVWNEQIRFDDPVDPLAGWEVKSGPEPIGDPVIFDVNDPRLLGDQDSPGSQSAGWYTNKPSVLESEVWLQQQFPGAVAPGTHTVRVEADWYVKKEVPDSYSVANRVFVLWDDLYNQPLWDYVAGATDDMGMKFDRANGYPDPLDNGVWKSLVHEQEVTTATGDIEVRLMMQNISSGQQAVAWDNVKLVVVTPCNDIQFDTDGDRDVDQDDFGVFQLCYTGADGVVTGDCTCLDSDNDSDVDSIDYAAFQACGSGPAVAADPICME